MRKQKLKKEKILNNESAFCIVNQSQELLGLITEGDLRRKLLKVQKPFSAFFVDDALIHSKRDPITCLPIDNLKEVVQLMGEKQIWDLPVVENKKLIGLVNLHTLVKYINKK